MATFVYYICAVRNAQLIGRLGVTVIGNFTRVTGQPTHSKLSGLCQKCFPTPYTTAFKLTALAYMRFDVSTVTYNKISLSGYEAV
jgi:hypothetical protein